MDKFIAAYTYIEKGYGPVLVAVNKEVRYRGTFPNSEDGL